jgi:excisionase family DNA binding protein
VEERTPEEVIPEPLLLRPREAFALLGIGHTAGYELLMSGDLPSIKIGRSRRIPRAALQDWIAAQIGISR